MAVNQVKYGNQIIIDITDSTVNANTLLAGYKAYGANGEQVTGNVELSYHITLTQAQYDELTEEEKLADENFFYIEDMEVTSAEIDDTTTATDKVWSSNKVNTEFGLKADKTQISNPNLLDNPWFTVNQRGKTSVTASNVYFVDRWKTYINNVVSQSYSISNDIVTIDNTSGTSSIYFTQKAETSVLNALANKTVTVSVMLSDGTILKGTRTYRSGSYINNGTINVYSSSSEIFTIEVFSGKSVSIKAAKLELGSISTLALDTAPNYTTELLKCQRYFYGEFAHKYAVLGYGYATSTTSVRIKVPLSVLLRAVPSVIIDASLTYIFGNGTSIVPSAITVQGIDSNGVQLNVTVANAVLNELYILKLNNTSLALTADL